MTSVSFPQRSGASRVTFVGFTYSPDGRYAPGHARISNFEPNKAGVEKTELPDGITVERPLEPKALAKAADALRIPLPSRMFGSNQHRLHQLE